MGPSKKGSQWHNSPRADSTTLRPATSNSSTGGRPLPRSAVGPRRLPELAATAVPLAAALVALLLAARSPSLAPHGVFPSGGAWILFLLATTACMLHRPFAGSTLGVGAVAIVPVLADLGAVPAALVAATALLLADLVRRLLRRRSPMIGPERRHWLRSLVHAGVLVLALLAAAAGATKTGDGKALALAGGIYAGVLALLRIADKKIRRPNHPLPWKSALLPIAGDGAAWVAGIAVAHIAAVSGWRTAGIILAGFSVLSLEAARHALLFGRSRQRVDDLERLSRASRRIAGEQPETGFRIVAERIRIECSNVVPFQWFQFELLARGSSYCSWWSGPDRGIRDGAPELPEAPPPRPGIHRRTSWRVIERSLETDEVLLGRLRLWCDPRQLEPQQVSLLDRLLPQMVASLQRALLDLEAKQDPLTGLAVRRVLEERLQRAHRKSLQLGTPMAVIMCDLDHFKNVNDTYGHAAGDQALIATAKLLLEAADHPERLATRYGGEEFTLLLESSSGDEALAIAEKLRQQVEQRPVEVDGDTLSLTLSLGVACFPELHVKRPQELMELADEALYEAKRHGRNRCLLHLGRGCFRTTQGGTVRGEAPPDAAAVPQIFA